MNIQTLLAKRTNRMSGSAIREILKVTANPEIISLAGGLPAPESFPIDIINKLHQQVIDKYGSAAFQYGITEGFVPFRNAIVKYVQKKGIKTTAENIYITSGSQGCLDALGKILINKDDYIAVETPTYLGAMSAFNPYEPNYIEIKTDNEGVIPDSLEEIVKNNTIKLVYLNPTFQNPTGKTLSKERRVAIAEILKKYDVLAVEDDPYGELRYRGQAVEAIKTYAPYNVIYISTMSKIFTPGLRLGFCICSQELGTWLTYAKQGSDLHSSSYGQALAAEYIDGNYLDEHLPRIIGIYKPRQEAMLNALEKYFPPEYKWTKPEGGMFIWVEGPKGLITEKLYWKAIEKNVAFVPGKYFYAEKNSGLETMRLNFTNTDEKTIEIAIERLATVIKEFHP
ncbi:PLP-dependent aminotransferase family protein [soil metagenome]